jgi:predicted AlkP superfamily pyrophosphatase or phosphodiesterase
VLLFPVILCRDSAPQADTPPGQEQCNVILISWDGVQREHLYQLLAEKRLSNLAALIQTGSMVEMVVSGHDTSTKPGHVEMLTGYPPELTGVWTNRDYNPIPEGITVMERVEEFFGVQNIVTVMLTGKKANLGAAPPRIGYRKKKKWSRARRGRLLCYLPAEPYFLTKNNIDVYDNNHADASVVGPKALGYIDRFASRRFFFFFHFSDPDHAGHKFGENSQQYSDAIVICDDWLGRIIDKLDEHGIYECTTIYVTTDHGFDEGAHAHRDAPDIWFVSNEPGLKSVLADQRDVAPTVLSRFGIDVSSIRPKLPGRSLLR